MSPRILPMSLLAAGVILAAPAAEAQQPPPNPTVQQPRQERQQQARRRGDRSRLTRQDLDEGGSAIVTARDAIRILRPHWLQPPVGRMATANVTGGGGGATEVVIYVDGTRQPNHEVLNMLRIAEIAEMRYLDQNRSVTLHGPGHEAGVIEIKTIAKEQKP
jgi:hypothetical protein